MLDQHDTNLVVFLAGAGAGCSLDSSPGENWVEKSGGLPSYICKIAKGVMKSGKSKSSAIAIAVSRVKKWAAGGDGVDADTVAKSAKAVAQWEALKAKNKAKQVVKATREDGAAYLMLSNVGSFNTEIVRRAWDAQERLRHHAYEEVHGDSSNIASPPSEFYSYHWVRELWSDFIIVESEGSGAQSTYLKIPYGVSGNKVFFGEPEPVEQIWQETDEVEDDDLNEIERLLLQDVLTLSVGRKSYLETIRSIAQK